MSVNSKKHRDQKRKRKGLKSRAGKRVPDSYNYFSPRVRDPYQGIESLLSMRH